MCEDCGCGIVEGYKVVTLVNGSKQIPVIHQGHDHDHPHEHTHPHAHEHGHAHGHGHEHSHEHSHGSTTIDLRRPILARNDRLAERNRGFLKAKGLVSVNLLSSPGSGKTTLLEKTLAILPGQFSPVVINGDLATDNDAGRLHASGTPVAQIMTGNVCHLDAEMVAKGLDQLPLDGRNLLFIENVGNLVCPASYDLGEDKKVVLFSVTEGEDKPLKYPPIFHHADLVIITKSDLAAAVGFDREAALRNLHHIAHHSTIIELSAKTGAGIDQWIAWLTALVSP